MATPSSILAREAAPRDISFGEALRSWRQHRSLSQLELALQAGVSARHLSFLETGRSGPSREMVARLGEALDVPLRDRNRLLLAAGFAPAYSESSLDDEHMGPVSRAVGLLLDRHEPYPAYAMDGAWNVVASNRTQETMLRQLVPGGAGEKANILHLLFSPDLLRPFVLDWENVARTVLRRLRAQLEGPGRPQALATVAAEIAIYPDVESLLATAPDLTAYDLFLPLGLQLGDRQLRWITTILSFGAPVDVNLSELVVECFFPADEETERYSQAGIANPVLPD